MSTEYIFNCEICFDTIKFREEDLLWGSLISCIECNTLYIMHGLDDDYSLCYDITSVEELKLYLT